MLNQLIERLVEEGYLNLKEQPRNGSSNRDTVRTCKSPNPCRAISSLKLRKKVSTFSVTKLAKPARESREKFSGTSRHAATFDRS